MVIIAAVDRTERAENVLRQSEKLSGAFNKPVHVIHVLSRSEFVALEQTAYDNTGQALSVDEIQEVASDYAETVSESLDVKHTALGRWGDPSSEIIEYANDIEADYIVLAPRRRSPAGKAIFGSVAQKIILNADCAVVTTSASTS